MPIGKELTKPTSAGSLANSGFSRIDLRAGNRPSAEQYFRLGSSSSMKLMNCQAPSLFLAPLNIVRVSENQSEARLLAGPIGSGRVANLSAPTFFFCWPLEPELCWYMLVTPRPKVSTISTKPSVAALGGVTLCLSARSRYQESASTACFELITTLPSFSTSAPFAEAHSLGWSRAQVPLPRMP